MAAPKFHAILSTVFQKSVRIFSLFMILNSAGVDAQQSGVSSWQNDKFSMFIHFGLYSHFGGVWQGKQIERGYSEQIQSHAGIHSDLYAAEAAYFNPREWNADSIVSLAKRAGMRSIVITSKHHDGFCMFDTETTDFNIVDATPFGRDVLKELSEACKRGGLNFGLYFSLIDWHYPQAYPISSHNADFSTSEHHNYNKSQLKELLTQYGPISELWFDMGSLTYNQSKELRDLVHQYQPNCLVSGRLGNDQGDFCVMGDNQYPDYQLAVPWQVPASVYDETWGHRSWQRKDPIEDKVAEKIRSLVQTAARGGNFLLNIGPDAEGAITIHEQEVLKGIGAWMAVNGVAIYGTTPVSSAENEVLLAQKGDTLFAYLFDAVPNGKLNLNGIEPSVKSIDFLDSPGMQLSYMHRNGILEILLPETRETHLPVRVVRIVLDSHYEIAQSEALSVKGNLVLSANNAIPEYSFSGVDYYSSYRSTVGYSWQINSKTSQSVRPELYYTAGDAGKQISLRWNGTQELIPLDEGAPHALPKIKTTWGTPHIAGPYSGFMDNPITDPTEASLATPWGGQSWIPVDQTEDVRWLARPASMFKNWYRLQEVNASRFGEVLVQIPTNDGVGVYVNGKAVYVGNNPLKEPNRLTEVILPLQKGKNTVLIQSFNRFNTSVDLGMELVEDQIVFKKMLPKRLLDAGNTYRIELKNNPNTPIHRNLGLSYVKLALNKE